MKYTASKVVGKFDGGKICEALRALGVGANLVSADAEGAFHIEVEVNDSADETHHDELMGGIAEVIDAADVLIALNRD